MAAACSAVEVRGLHGELDVPEAVTAIARRLEDHGYETWAVGGAVRDALLDVSRGDWDLATAARPETVSKLFRPSYPVGIQFGTVGVRGSDGHVYEVTTFRRDIETDGRHAVVEYAERLDDDLARRDFTINAIAYHPLRHVYHDPFGGWEDLQRKLLRAVGEPVVRFAEDYLRVLRGLRFAGAYALEIEQATWEALTGAVPKLPRLSGERVREEVLKVLAAPLPSSSLELYRRSGALAILAPELSGIDDADWRVTLGTIDRLPAYRLRLRLAALLMPAAPTIEPLMKRLRFSNAELRSVAALSAALDSPLPGAEDVTAARRWLRQVSPENARDALWLHFKSEAARGAGAEARSLIAGQARTILGIMRRGEPVTVADLAIDGNDLKALGLRPGPDFARILEACLDAVIEDPTLNRREMLLERARRQVED
jgi:tRNA nucleotidyltransferase (CCA-adding enzyme)